MGQTVTDSGVNQQFAYRINVDAIAEFNLSGPIYIPDKFNSDKSKLFFFLSHEWGRQTPPPAPLRVMVPTVAERQGDFSNTRDAAGVPVTIKDPLPGQAFPGNRI